MKKILSFFVLMLMVSCTEPGNCWKSSGDPAVRSLDVSQTPFLQIEINPGIGLILKQGPEYAVEIRSGENIIDDIQAKVSNGKLIVKDESGCNFSRAYGQTVVHVTAPNLEEIYSNSDQEVRSEGVLSFVMLRLYSMDFFGGVGTGDFHLQVDNSQLVVQSNHVSAFYITGHTNQLLLHFYNGIGRFEGADFLAEDIEIFHRGSNDMIVHPVQTLRGDIFSTGDVISVSHPLNPPTVNEHYSGRLIFQH